MAPLHILCNTFCVISAITKGAAIGHRYNIHRFPMIPIHCFDDAAKVIIYFELCKLNNAKCIIVFVIILFPLKPIGELQVEVGHGGVIDELFVRADGGAVEVVGDAQFGGEGEVIDEACASHEPVADAFAVEHGEGELIEGCPFVEVES